MKKQKERELRLLVPGPDNAGETTILKKLNREDIYTISPTLGFNIRALEHWGSKLHIWDVGSQKSLWSYQQNCFESTDGLIWAVDRASGTVLVEEGLAGATLLIFANKQNLPGPLLVSSNSILEAQELDSIQSYYWCMQGCSAVTGDNLLPEIVWLLHDISSRIFTAREPLQMPPPGSPGPSYPRPSPSSTPGSMGISQPN